MRIRCKWCKPSKIMGEKKPFSDNSITNGICDKCLLHYFPHHYKKIKEALMSGLPENLPSSVYTIAWATLYNCFGKTQQEAEMKLMDTVLQTVEDRYREGMEQRGIQNKKTS